jgi:hypothetical protein
MTEPNLTSDDRNKVALYFLDLHLRYLFLALFAGLILVEFWLGKLILLCGCAWAAVAVALAARRPSDVEIDALFARDLRSLAGQALSRLKPDEMETVGPPYALFGPAAPAAAIRDRPFSRPRKGHDGRLRSPCNQAVILLPLEDQLGIFSCDHDSISGLTSQASVEEHHYRDVVSVRFEEGTAETERSVLAAAKPGRASGTRPLSQVFSLDLTNGRRLSVPVSVAWHEDVSGSDAVQPTDLEKFVLAIRALMRDKR